ncbi:MAG: hypothetical protein CL609_20280 [Anaerolineaceae bacterium]|nr:hypothetical protein [Anaerolineaceae bacterium]
MKIAIYHNLPSGGAKRLLYEFTKRLHDHHEIHIYTTSSANHDFCDLRPFAAAYHIYPFTPGVLFKSPFGRLNQIIRTFDLYKLNRLEKQIANDIRLEKFDSVLVQPCQFQNAPSLLQHLHDMPTVFYCHEPLRILYETMPPRPYDQDEGGLRRLVDKIDPMKAIFYMTLKNNDRKNVSAAKSVLVNSIFNRGAVKKIYSVDPSVCYPGVDINFFKPSLEVEENFVLSVGSLTPLKGFDLIIQSLGLIPENIRPIFKIASNFSNQPEYQYIQSLAEKHHVTTEFHSGISDEALVSLYNRALFTIYTPIREPFGLVPIESMACGTPVIGVNEGGLMETILHGETGFLVNRDPIEISEKILVLIQQKITREKFSQTARQYVLEKWTWEHSTQKLEKILSNV